MTPPIRTSAIAALVLLIGVSVVAVVVADRSFQWWQQTRSQRTLQEIAARGEASIRFEIDSIQTHIDDLQVSLERTQAQAPPSPETIRDLAGAHRLELRQLERINPAAAAQNAQLGYRIALSGTVGQVHRFLHEFEERHRFEIRQVLLQAANAEGSRVLLSVHLEVDQR